MRRSFASMQGVVACFAASAGSPTATVAGVPSPYRTYRQPSRWVLTALALVAAGGAFLSNDPAIRLVGLAILLMAVWGAWWTRLTVTETGLTVVNLRQQSIPWAAVRHLSLDARRLPWAGPALTITTHDKRLIHAWAVSVTRATSEQFCRETLEAVQTAKRQHPSS